MEFNKQYAKKAVNALIAAGLLSIYAGNKSDLDKAFLADKEFAQARALVSKASDLEEKVKTELGKRRYFEGPYAYGAGDKVKTALDNVDELHRQAYAIMPEVKFNEKNNEYVGNYIKGGLANLLALGALGLATRRGYQTFTKRD